MDFEEFSALAQREFRNLYPVGSLEITKRDSMIDTESDFLRLKHIYDGDTMWIIEGSSKCGVYCFIPVYNRLATFNMNRATAFMNILEAIMKYDLK